MAAPDAIVVAEMLLFAEGFAAAARLARKTTALYSLAAGQLSPQVGRGVTWLPAGDGSRAPKGTGTGRRQRGPVGAEGDRGPPVAEQPVNCWWGAAALAGRCSRCK